MTLWMQFSPLTFIEPQLFFSRLDKTFTKLILDLLNPKIWAVHLLIEHEECIFANIFTLWTKETANFTVWGFGLGLDTWMQLYTFI